MLMHSKEPVDHYLDGLNELLKLHQQVFNDDEYLLITDGYANFNVAWPEEYRVIRNTLINIKGSQNSSLRDAYPDES